jgi:hypothetical protein
MHANIRKILKRVSPFRMAVCLALLIGVASVTSCTVQAVVRERPAEVVYERPVAPSREHVWVTGDWVWQSGHYQWHEGHYERPRPGVVWEGGHWQEVRGGWRWVNGHWRNV